MIQEDKEWLSKQVEIRIPTMEDFKQLLLESEQTLRSDMEDALHYMLSTKQVR